MRAKSPGQILKVEWLGETEITIDTFSKKSGLSVDYLERLIDDKVKINPNAALCMAKATGLSYQYWLNVQKTYDNFKKQDDKK